MIGEITQNTRVSAYQPSKEVADFTKYCKQVYSYGVEVLNRPFLELNDRSVLDDLDRGQRTFNAFVDENIENPAEAWKWRGTRSKGRNKAIHTHANLTAGYIIPMFMAQNEDDEEDTDFSAVMQDIVEWMVHNSPYKSSFLRTVMGMLMNPINYLGAEYNEVYQAIKQKAAEGYTTKQIIDEELSGFQAPVYTAGEVLINNPYLQNIQHHKDLIKRRWIDYGEGYAKYGTHQNWDYIQPGISTIFNEDDEQFYDIKDEQHTTLVEEVIYQNRRDDTEVVFVGGIYLGDDNLYHNAMRHRTHRGAPKYNLVPFGYNRVNEHFFFYKSLMNSMYWDNRLIDAQYEMGMNRVFLETNMPIAVSGSDKIDSEVIFPSSVVTFEDKDTKVTPMLPKAELGNIFNAMKQTEESMEEASVSEMFSGQLPKEASHKATAIVAAEEHAKTLLRGVGKTLAESMIQYGDLMADIAVHNLSTAQVESMLGDQTKIKYRTLILKDKTVSNRQTSKVLKFDKDLLGSTMSPAQRKKKSLELLEQINYPDNKNHLYLINPEIFAQRRYLTRIEPEQMFPKNQRYMQDMTSYLYRELRNDPLIDAEALVRKILYAFWQTEAEDLMAKRPTTEEVAAIAGRGERPEVDKSVAGAV